MNWNVEKEFLKLNSRLRITELCKIVIAQRTVIYKAL